MKLRTKGFMLKKHRKPEGKTLDKLHRFIIDHTERHVEVSERILADLCFEEFEALEEIRNVNGYYLQYIIE